MGVLITACSDIGIKRKTNQDSLYYKQGICNGMSVLAAVVCDGMGGLEKGEVASADVVRAIDAWFMKELPALLNPLNMQEIEYTIDKVIKTENQKIGEYGRNNGIQLGTTLTLFLAINGNVLIAHVGDSRAYEIGDTVKQLTEDQTVVGREIGRGNMTREEADNDPRKNVLLQCIGASRSVSPDYIHMKAVEGNAYMLCSDGFRHKITDDELMKAFSPVILTSEDVMRQQCLSLIELNKSRQETDNISVLLMKF